MPFTANQILIPARPVPDDDLEKIGSTVAGEVATKLGALLKQAYNHTRPVAMEFKKAAKLKDSKKLKGKTGLKYTITVDSKAKSILLKVGEGSKMLEEVVLYAKLEDLGGAVVVNLDKGDPTIDRASDKQAKKFNGATATAKDEDVKLKGINLKKKIVLCGHGGGPDVSGDKVYTANEFGSKSADEIVKFLIKQGLDSKYEGTIYLSGCHTAAGFKDPKSFAATVHKALAGKGYKSLSVAGTPGLAYTKESGDKGSVPAVLEEQLNKTIKEVDASITKYEALVKQAASELKSALDEDKVLEDQVKSTEQLLDGLPPEALPKLQAQLLDPVVRGRQTLAKVITDMRKANKTLEAGLKSEQDYMKKLKDLKRDKKKMADGKIDDDELWERQKNKAAVEEWWGHFGPAKATKVKLKADTGKLASLFAQVKAKLGTKSKSKS
ncbi:MAG: hypothetical protein EOP39_08555 [Rubrivivax sp.]|nr:MAG: hypothetical protein EOP39_08555 [Rubrivivax sp.]